MKNLLFILTFLFPLFVAAQTDSTANKSNNGDTIKIMEQAPSYPGDVVAMMKFFKNNIIYPDSAYKNKLEGKVMVQFIVEPDGSVTSVKALKTFDESCAREAERVVGLMKWNPGIQKDKPVRVKVIISVNFRIN